MNMYSPLLMKRDRMCEDILTVEIDRFFGSALF